MIPKRASLWDSFEAGMAKEDFLTSSNQSRLVLPGVGSKGKLSRAAFVTLVYSTLLRVKSVVTHVASESLLP